MKMTLEKALLILGLPSYHEVKENKINVKKAYKIAALKVHPDRTDESSNSCMAEINSAYDFLKGYKSFWQEASYSDEKLSKDFQDNEGHKLCGSGLPTLKPVDMLLREAFDIRDTLESMPSIRPVVNNVGCNSIYFQHKNDDFRISLFGGRSNDQLYIECLSNAGKVGKNCLTLKLCVESWAYPDNQRCISNVLVELIKNTTFSSGEPIDGFSWGEVYSEIFNSINKDDAISTNIFGYEFKLVESRYGVHWICDIDGNELRISIRNEQAIRVFNPFKLGVYKRLKAIPEKFKLLDLVKVLVNGQYMEHKVRYHYTDDYAYDAAVNYRRGYVENPFHAIQEWIHERGRKNSSRVYKDSNTGINFGFHSNDCSSLIVALDNHFPLVDLSEDVKALHSTLKLP